MQHKGYFPLYSVSSDEFLLILVFIIHLYVGFVL